jgi:hypothetical protein
MVNTEYKRYLARIPKTYAMRSTLSPSWVYSTDVFDLELVLILPAYIQCAEPSDKDIIKCVDESITWHTTVFHLVVRKYGWEMISFEIQLSPSH